MIKKLLHEKNLKIAESYQVKGEKMGETGVMKDMKKEMYYPHLHLNSKDLPAIKDWEVGKDYTIVLKVTQKSVSSHMDGETEKHSADFDIKEIGVVDSKEVKSEKKEEPSNKKDTIKKMYA